MPCYKAPSSATKSTQNEGNVFNFNVDACFISSLVCLLCWPRIIIIYFHRFVTVWYGNRPPESSNRLAVCITIDNRVWWICSTQSRKVDNGLT